MRWGGGGGGGGANTKVWNGRPQEPHRSREISRLPKLRALGNVLAFSIIQTFHWRASVTLFRHISVSTGSPSRPLERGGFGCFCNCF